MLILKINPKYIENLILKRGNRKVKISETKTVNNLIP